VIVTACGAQQRLVGGVLDQGVLERVGSGGWRAAAKDQPGFDELVEGGYELAIGKSLDGGELLVGGIRGR